MLEGLKVIKRVPDRYIGGAIWISGTYKNYFWQAEIFSVGSRYGINKGRVSRLWIKDNKTSEWVYNFDRGLDVRPKNKDVTKLKNYIVSHSLEIRGK